ncbi:MAG TPA: Os1348 family NHLP clan protein [Thermoanaerobaculia bacterium]
MDAGVVAGCRAGLAPAEEDLAMSQRNVELVLGKLATDEDFRHRFAASPEAALSEAAGGGLDLTPVEQRALIDLEVGACERFAACLDPRIQKIGHSRPC